MKNVKKFSFEEIDYMGIKIRVAYLDKNGTMTKDKLMGWESWDSVLFFAYDKKSANNIIKKKQRLIQDIISICLFEDYHNWY